MLVQWRLWGTPGPYLEVGELVGALMAERRPPGTPANVVERGRLSGEAGTIGVPPPERTLSHIRPPPGNGLTHAWNRNTCSASRLQRARSRHLRRRRGHAS